MFYNILSVALGGALGASLRYLISLKFNAYLTLFPLGTLLVNLLGAYLIGLFLVYFAQTPNASNWLKLFVITGCLGALTTFSTFSAEIFHMINQGDLYTAIFTILLHILGSIAMVALGFYSWTLIKSI